MSETFLYLTDWQPFVEEVVNANCVPVAFTDLFTGIMPFSDVF
jgi:hypothetical protein